MFRKGVWVFSTIFLLVSCGERSESSLQQAEPSEDLVEVVEAPPKVEAEEVGVEEVAKPNPNLIPMELRQQMIAYLTEIEETEVEASMVDVGESLPFDLMLGRDFADFLAVHGSPNQVYTTFEGPPDVTDSYFELFPRDVLEKEMPFNWATYDHLAEWLGFAVGVSITVDAQNIITLVALKPYSDKSNSYSNPEFREFYQRFRDAEKTFFDQTYQLLVDNREAKVAFIQQAVEQGALEPWRVRAFYRFLSNFAYLTPEGYLVDSRGVYLDAMRYAREGGFESREDETQLDEALWQENTPESPFSAKVGDSLHTLLTQEDATLSFFLTAWLLDRDEESSLFRSEVGITLDPAIESGWNRVDRAFREAEGNAYITWWNDYGGGVAMISLMAIKPEHRLSVWQTYRSKSDREDLYFVDKEWQGLAIRVVYHVRANKIVRRYYVLSSEALRSW